MRFILAILLINIIAVSDLYAVCMQPAGIHGSVFSDEQQITRKHCAHNSDRAVLGCWEALNKETVKNIEENFPGSYTANCSSRVTDEEGSCILSAVCKNNMCEIPEHNKSLNSDASTP